MVGISTETFTSASTVNGHATVGPALNGVSSAASTITNGHSESHAASTSAPLLNEGVPAMNGKDSNPLLHGPLSSNPATRFRQMLARPGIIVRTFFFVTRKFMLLIWAFACYCVPVVSTPYLYSVSYTSFSIFNSFDTAHPLWFIDILCTGSPCQSLSPSPPNLTSHRTSTIHQTKAAPGICDGISARCALEAGFEVLYQR